MLITYKLLASIVAFHTIFIFLFQRLISFIIRYTNVKHHFQGFSVGYMLGNSFYFVQLKLGQITIRVRKISIAWFLSIHIKGLEIIMDDFNHSIKSEKGVSNIDMRLPINNYVMKFIQWSGNLTIMIDNIRIHLKKLDYIINFKSATLRFSVPPTHESLSFSLLIHSLLIDQNTSIDSVDYSFCSFIHESKCGNYWNLVDWKSYLKVKEFKIKIEQKLLFSHNNDHFHSTLKYKTILQNLNLLDIKMENITIIWDNNFKLFVSNLILYIKSVEDIQYRLMGDFHSDAGEQIGSEMTLSANTIVFHLYGAQIFCIPVVNFVLISDILSFFLEHYDINMLKIRCTLNVIDPLISLTLNDLIILRELLASDNSNKTTGNSILYLIHNHVYPSFKLKLMLSNLSLSLKVLDLGIFVMRFNNITALIKHSITTDKNSLVLFEDIKTKKVFNSQVKNSSVCENFMLSYVNMVDKKDFNAEIPLLCFSKWDFSNNDITEIPIKLSSTLEDLTFNLTDLDILKSLQEVRKILVNKTKSPVKKTLNIQPYTMLFDVNLRMKNVSLSVKTVGYLPKHLDNLECLGKNLNNSIIGFDIAIDDSYMSLNSETITLNIIYGTISRLFTNTEGESTCDQIMCLKTSSVSITHQLATIMIPYCKVNFDINLIWLSYYFKNIVVTYFPHKNNVMSNTKFSLCIRLHVTSLIISAVLPQKFDILWLFKNMEYNSKRDLLTVQLLQVLIKSIYAKETPVYVPLLTFHDFTTCITPYYQNYWINVNTSTIRFNSEYHLRLYKVIDNIIIVLKSYHQIKLGFTYLDDFRVIQPTQKPPIIVPKVTIRTEFVTINIEDDPFEQELGLIYKIGILEQRERLEKFAYFDELLSNQTEISSKILMERRIKLFENISRSWIHRFQKAKLNFHGNSAYIIKNKEFEGEYSTFSNVKNSNVLSVSLENFVLDIASPSFPLDQLPDFIYEYGKGVPRSSVYSFSIPLGVEIKTGKVEFLLRDYPLPIISFPDATITGDIVFAEHMVTKLSTRSIFVPFLLNLPQPYNKTYSIYGSNIVRTLTPIKTYMNLKCTVKSCSPTIITWGKSLQPGYQSVMLWFDYLTKPPLDPSEKLGFWDKFRLLIHGRFEFDWHSNSYVHFNIKGSEDPYKIVDEGAGLSFCWGEGVKMVIHGSDDPQEFFKIESKKFMLNILDFSNTNHIDKVLVKLSGHVLWKVGMLFEAGFFETAGQQERKTTFKPHYQVTLTNPIYISDIASHDSYKGFRSNFIHMSFGVYSDDQSIATNSVHLAPGALNHFLRWWRLFSTYTSGPIRQGPLFPDLLQNGKKFGKSLFTVKYQLSLSPLTITHVYTHADSQLDLKQNNKVSFTGLKGSIASLKVDFHQKKIKTLHKDKILQVSRPVWGLKINSAEIDCLDADIRILSTMFDQEAIEELLAKNLGLFSETEDESYISSLSQNPTDFNSNSIWYDFDDYVDLDQISLKSKLPLRLCAIPFLFSPRISYVRNITDEGLTLKYPFGNENVHRCFIGKNFPENTQKKLANEREKELLAQIKTIVLSIDSLNHQKHDNVDFQVTQNELLNKLQKDLHDIKHRLHVIHEVLRDLESSKDPKSSLELNDIESDLSPDLVRLTPEMTCPSPSLTATTTTKSSKSMGQLSNGFVKSTFDNQFVIHNVLLKINKSIRDHLLNYMASIAETGRSRYFMTHNAIKLIEELVKNKFKRILIFENELSELKDDYYMNNTEYFNFFEDLIREIPNSGFSAFDSYMVKFISPQIQITSPSEPDKAILIASRRIKVSIIDIRQINNVDEKDTLPSSNSLMETKYCATFTDSNFFILDRDTVSSNNSMGFSMNGYGMDENSSYWPPWMPIEMCYDNNPLRNDVFLKKNTMFITFTRPNYLFFDNQSKLTQISGSSIRIGCPELYLRSNSEQYSAIYNIIQEMLTFVSATDKKLEKLMQIFLADELKNNLNKLEPSLVENLQNKVRKLKYLRSMEKLYDPKSHHKYEQEIAVSIQAAFLELNLLMNAIKRNYEKIKSDEKEKSGRLNWLIGADHLIWELYGENKNPFITLRFETLKFMRSQDFDGANSNKISIKSLHCFNLQENQVYGELLLPYHEYSNFEGNNPLVQINWIMGSPVGGITNLEELTVLLQPIKFKMDYKTSDKLMKYLFPDTRISSNNKTSSTSSKESFESHTVLSSTLANSSNIYDTSYGKFKRLAKWNLGSIAKKNLQDTVRTWNIKSEMSEMVLRSNTFFNVNTVVIKSLVMSVSYKGSRSLITNVDNLIVKVPTIRYVNKIWSRDEFISTLKKDIIKIVFQHTGDIISNKFVLHKKELNLMPGTSNLS